MNYKILTVRERIRIDEEEKRLETVKIKFSLNSGFIGTVELKKKGFTHEKARKAIEKYVRELDLLLKKEEKS